MKMHTRMFRVAISDVHGDYTYEDVYLRSWDLAKGILGRGYTSHKSHTSHEIFNIKYYTL